MTKREYWLKANPAPVHVLQKMRFIFLLKLSYATLPLRPEHSSNAPCEKTAAYSAAFPVCIRIELRSIAYKFKNKKVKREYWLKANPVPVPVI